MRPAAGVEQVLERTFEHRNTSIYWTLISEPVTDEHVETSRRQ
jgi:hypothetical protein